MKKLKEFLISLLISVVLAILLVCMYFGAVLQESYKLCPLTEAEVTGE